MGRILDFYWDFSSPFAYLGSTQVDALVARTGATLVERPMLLGALLKAAGAPEVPLFTWPEAKRRYVLQDVQRWADYWGVPFRFPSRFPVASLRPLRAFLALPESKRAAFRQATFRAAWAEDRDIGEECVLRTLLGDEADPVMVEISTAEAKEKLFRATQTAVDAGVFGAPTFVVDGKDLYWGQDRLALVERALRAPAAR